MAFRGLALLRFLILFFSGWINREQLWTIEYLQTEYDVLRELNYSARSAGG